MTITLWCVGGCDEKACVDDVDVVVSKIDVSSSSMLLLTTTFPMRGDNIIQRIWMDNSLVRWNLII
jgi:hypothetical protein